MNLDFSSNQTFLFSIFNVKMRKGQRELMWMIQRVSEKCHVQFFPAEYNFLCDVENSAPELSGFVTVAHVIIYFPLSHFFLLCVVFRCGLLHYGCIRSFVFRNFQVEWICPNDLLSDTRSQQTKLWGNIIFVYIQRNAGGGVIHWRDFSLT